MTTPLISADLQQFEGFRAAPYQDPGGVWTQGFGNTQGVTADSPPVTETQALATLEAEITDHEVQLDADPLTGSWWRTLDDVRQDALVELSFNMGERTLDEFVNTLGALKDGEFATAEANLLDSEWAQEVHGARSNWIGAMIGTGARPS